MANIDYDYCTDVRFLEEVVAEDIKSTFLANIKYM